MHDFVVVNDSHDVCRFKVAGMSTPLDLPWVYVEPSCFVDEMDDGEAREEGFGRIGGRFPEPLFVRRQLKGMHRTRRDRPL